MSVCTVQKLHEETGYGLTSLYKLITEGVLDARKCGKRTLITRESIARWAASLPPMEPGSTSYGITRRKRNRVTSDQPQPAA